MTLNIRKIIRLTVISAFCVCALESCLKWKSSQPSSSFETRAGTIDPRETRENCRLLGIVTRTQCDNTLLRDHLKHFARPSYPQDSGWSLAAYSNIEEGGHLAIPGQPMIIRTQTPVLDDAFMFDTVSSLILRLRPAVILGHLRNASSGCVQVADPHPFMMKYDNKYFLMTHNGGVWGKDLVYLTDYMISGDTLPENCPDSPIDSEYLFIYLMEIIERNSGDVWKSVYEWAQTLTMSFEKDWNALNIILTDGDIIWGVRISYRNDRFPLHYKKLDTGDTWGISTQALDADWILLPNFSIIEIRSGHPAYVELLPRPILEKPEIHYPVKSPFLSPYDE